MIGDIAYIIKQLWRAYKRSRMPKRPPTEAEIRGAFAQIGEDYDEYLRSQGQR